MKKLALAALAAIVMLSVFAQSKPGNPNRQQKRPDPTFVVTNNNKVLTAAGDSLLSEKDFISVRVRHDTVFFTLKDDALKRLEANPGRYYKQ